MLSPTSGRNDRIDKLREYRAVASIRRYVILEYAGASVTVFKRATEAENWTATALMADDVLHIPDIGVQVPVAELYENVELPDAEPEA